VNLFLHEGREFSIFNDIRDMTGIFSIYSVLRQRQSDASAVRIASKSENIGFHKARGVTKRPMFNVKPPEPVPLMVARPFRGAPKLRNKI
jgi:hypothetical protein